MSLEKAKAFLTAMKEKEADDALTRKAADAKTEEEKLELAVETAKEMGYDVTAEELKEALWALVQERDELVPLEDEDAEAVAGGGIGTQDDELTLWQCHSCGTAGAEVKKTGNTRSYLLVFTQYEYKCKTCGALYWLC